MRAIFEAIDTAPMWIVFVLEALATIAFIHWTQKKKNA